jgi:hypothetical protein
MLRLRLNLPLRCPKHPNFNPEKQGQPNIKGNCIHCQALCDMKRKFQTFHHEALTLQGELLSLAKTMNKLKKSAAKKGKAASA